ncbi:hypothetical protein ETD83_35065 [Actinomadura soli]|uniref:Uncharacterized protein n=1 Tax=Actinomadura soli TaxID=2508997 RepID=A0A5C4J1E6_9ACTN|nr:hypothetical protein [Actinomadura soli]TMQ90522.1 hypothetical protein ETD83_35065 [Actinomadura soli]
MTENDERRHCLIVFLSSFGPGGPAVLIAVPSSFGPWRPSIVERCVRSLHRFGSPGGSLRDQVLASLEPAFGRDRGGFGCCVVAVVVAVVAQRGALSWLRGGGHTLYLDALRPRTKATGKLEAL